MDAVAHFYSGPQAGSGIPIYSGSRRQMGSGLWSTIQRIARPILARFLPSNAKVLASKAIGAVAGAASDALANRSSFGESLKARAKVETQQTLDDIMRQTGGRRRSVKRRRFRSSSSKPTKKARKPTKARKTRTVANQRRSTKRRARFPW